MQCRCAIAHLQAQLRRNLGYRKGVGGEVVDDVQGVPAKFAPHRRDGKTPRAVHHHNAVAGHRSSNGKSRLDRAILRGDVPEIGPYGVVDPLVIGNSIDLYTGEIAVQKQSKAGIGAADIGDKLRAAHGCRVVSAAATGAARP